MSTGSVAFDRAAEYYDQTRGFPPGEEKNAAALIARAGNFSQSSRVLEVGIGTGRIALPLAAHVQAVFGIDLSRPMLARLESKRTSEKVLSVEGSATQLPFPMKSLDAAVAVHVFHLIPDWRAVLAEVARVLKPGGMLLHGSTGNYHIEDLWRAWRDLQAVEATVGVSWDERDTFLEKEGWRPVGEAMTHHYNYQQSPAEFLESLRRRCWSNTWTLSDEELNRSLRAMEAIIAEKYPEPDKPITIESGFELRAYLPPK
jgi:SAM-dependent methyltransferase